MLSPHPLKPGFVVLPGKTRDDFIAALPSERSGPLAVGAMQRPTRAWTVDERPVGRDVTAPGRSCEAAFRTSKSVRSNDRSARNAIAPRRQPGRPLSLLSPLRLARSRWRQCDRPDPALREPRRATGFDHEQSSAPIGADAPVQRNAFAAVAGRPEARRSVSTNDRLSTDRVNLLSAQRRKVDRSAAFCCAQ